jgi:hypothetical protein
MLTCKVGKSTVDTFTYKEDQLREWSNKEMLKCPVCGEKMLYCHGDFKIAYFRHEKNTDCPDIYSEGVTEEHISGIKLLYNWLKNQEGIENLELEKWIPETRQRPDIYFTKEGQEYVIEFQCSPIATKFNERRDLYKLQNINDIWILGMDKYNLPSIKSIENCIYNRYLFEKRMKTIEIEILNSNNLTYIDTNNNRVYITNNKLTAPAIREKVGYYSGKSYEVKMKVIYAMDLLSNSINSLKLDNFINNCDVINNASNNEYYKNIVQSEISYIEKYIESNINLKILNIYDDNNRYNIKYQDINNKIYDIYYDYKGNDWNGFKIKNKNNSSIGITLTVHDDYLYYNSKPCSKIINKDEFNLMGDLIYNDETIKNKINLLIKEFNINKINKLYKEPIVNSISIFNSFLQEDYNSSKTYIDWSLSNINENYAKIYLVFNYENDKYISNYFIKETCNMKIIDILNDFYLKIKKYMSDENIYIRKLLNEINTHFYKNIKWCSYYGNLIQSNFENEDYYIYKFEINNVKHKLKVQYNAVELDNDRYIINGTNARKIIINIIANCIRKLKYNTKRGLNNGQTIQDI